MRLRNNRLKMMKRTEKRRRKTRVVTKRTTQLGATLRRIKTASHALKRSRWAPMVARTTTSKLPRE